MNQHEQFGTVGHLTVHPAVVAVLIVACLLILFLPRKHVAVPCQALALMIPLGQGFMIGPAHFQVNRVLIFVMWIRLLVQRYGIDGGAFRLKLNTADKALLWYGITSVACYTALWQQFA